MNSDSPGLSAAPRALLVLTVGSVIYLAAPYLLFFLGWLDNLWAALFSLLLVVAFAASTLDSRRSLGESNPIELGDRGLLTWRGYLWVLVVAAALILLSGIGGYGFQDLDWTKHNIVLRDLIYREWPVAYTYSGVPVSLVYYIAYYLPAALLGKMGGWLFANQILALWSLLGLAMVMLWFLILVGRRPVWAVLLLFVFFSGLDAVGGALTHSSLGAFWPEESFPSGLTFLTNLDSWAGKWEFSSMLKLLFTVPNQALSGWLASALLLFTILNSRSARNLLFVWGLTALWTPFVTFGLAPFLAADLLLWRGLLWSRLRQYFSFQNMVGLLILALVIVYFVTKFVPIFPGADMAMRNGFFFAELASASAKARWALMLLLFWLLEFGLVAALIVRSDGLHTVAERTLFVVALVWLVVLPFWVFGEVNDLNMRSSIPSLFWVAALSARSLLAPNTTWLQRTLWVVLISLAAINPAKELTNHLSQIVQQGQLRHFKLDETDERTIVAAFRAQPDRLTQYVSSSASPFFLWLTKERGEPSTQPILFDDRLVLRDVAIASQQIAPGSETSLATVFEMLDSSTSNYSFATRLIGADGLMLWEQEAWPAGRPTSGWRLHRPQFDTRTIEVPAHSKPGIYRLDAYITDPDRRDKVAAIDLLSGQDFGQLVALGYLVVGDPDLVPRHPVSESVFFGEEIELLGDNLDLHARPAPGDTLSVELVWRAAETSSTEWTATVQLLDEAGRLIAQQDHPPLEGFVPMRLWQPGFTAVDRYELELPTELEPGSYHLIVALYDGNGRRQDVQVAGRELGDTFKITEIVVPE
ncbi:MAG: hypothetical protein HC802_04310 [Caldilineaceae bacterium]|nr:hypothetical protein [Caldilineaceae bacterium]